MSVSVSTPVTTSSFESSQSYITGIHRLNDGNFVVVYDDTSDARAIYAQIFSPDGATVGDPIFVASPAADDADGADLTNYPTVTNLAWGGFAVSWFDRGREVTDLFTRTFYADGTPVGDPIQLEVITGAVAADFDDLEITQWGNGYNSIWSVFGTGSGSARAEAEVYNLATDFDGMPLADIWNVTAGAPGEQSDARIISLFDAFGGQNGLVLTYVDNSGGASTIQAVVYDENGAFFSSGPITSEPYSILYTDLAPLTDGSYVVSWWYRPSEDVSQPVARIVRPDGISDPIGLLPNNAPIWIPSVNITETGGGGFAMSYVQLTNPDTQEKAVMLRVFNDLGGLVEGPIEIARGVDIRPWETELTTLTDGSVAVAWSEQVDFDYDGFVSVVDFGGTAPFLDCTPTLIGTDGNDRLLGDDCDNTIEGMSGNDVLRGEAGNDILLGGDGADTLNGGEGDDTITGGETDEDRRDVIYAGDGDDTADAGAGNDLVFGQDGNDTIAGGAGADELQGQDGDDVITGSAFSDLVFGGEGDDFVNGGFGFDRINGGTGADKFFHAGAAGHGSDWVQDYSSAQGDVLMFGGAASASDFVVRFAHTASATGERSGNDDVQEAFVNYRGQTLWALVDGGGQDRINLQIGGDTFDLLA